MSREVVVPKTQHWVVAPLEEVLGAVVLRWEEEHVLVVAGRMQALEALPVYMDLLSVVASSKGSVPLAFEAAPPLAQVKTASLEPGRNGLKGRR